MKISTQINKNYSYWTVFDNISVKGLPIFVTVHNKLRNVVKMIQNLIFFRHQICITGWQSIIGTSFELFSILRKIVVQMLQVDLTYLFL